MDANTQLQDFKDYLDSMLTPSVPINTSFQIDIAYSLAKYAKDKGLKNAQDVIRLAVANFLTKSGYIKNNS